MQDLLFSINALLPIIITVVIGWLLKRIKLFNDGFLSAANKLTFNVLLPVMLFNNIYKVQSFSTANLPFILYAVIFILLIFAVFVPIVMAFNKEGGQRGVLLQAVYRSNYAIIGVPLATLLFGDEGAAAASLLSAFTIPVYNILAVISLTMFDKDKKGGGHIKRVFFGIIKNPLIWGVLLGLLAVFIRSIFVRYEVDFRLSDIGFVSVTLDYLGRAATPIALLTLGGQFEFSAVKRLKTPIIFGTVARTVIVPLLGIFIAYFMFPDMGGECFASYIALFGTPVAVSSAIMAQEMGSDGELAGQLVVWTTLTSAITLFILITIFRSMGIL